MPRFRAIIRRQDDGAALKASRVLRKNSNDNATQWVWDDVFIAKS
jgi:hypothetical protein